MFRLSKNRNIELTRGDSCEFSIWINFGDRLNPETYMLKDSDTLYFGILEPFATFETAIVKKKFTAENQSENGFMKIKLKSDDTANLLPGRYYYTAKLRYFDDDNEEQVKTIVPECEFYIL